MSTLARYQPAQLQAASWDNDLRMAEALSMSELMPQAYRGSIPNTLIAIDIARRINASILQVAQNLHIISGKPSWSASFLIATVNSSGKFTRLKPVFTGERMERGCRMVATDLADDTQCVGTLFTYAMAEAEGYIKRTGSKWKTFGEQMLVYRAASLWVRVYCPEISLGMSTVDEQEDIDTAPHAVGGTPAASTPRRGSRASASATPDADKLNRKLEASSSAVVIDTTVQAQAATVPAATSAPKGESLGDRLAAAAHARAQAQEQAQRITPQVVNVAAVGVTSATGTYGGEVGGAAYIAEQERQAREFFANASPEDREPGADDEPLGG